MFRTINDSNVRQNVWRNRAKAIVAASILVCLLAIIGWTQNKHLSAASVPSDPFPGINRNSTFGVYYGNDFTPTHMEILKKYDVLVLQPDYKELTPLVVQALQEAGVTVIGYISIGEDVVDIDKVAAGEPVSPMVLDGSGPVEADSSNGNAVKRTCGDATASFYVDQKWLARPRDPDTNQPIPGTVGDYHAYDCSADKSLEFGGYYVYPNEEWREMILNQRRYGKNADGSPVSSRYAERNLVGLKQIAQDRNPAYPGDTGDYGFDGFFLDTLDTAGPWNNVGYYPWTAPAMKETVKFIRDSFPDKLIIANRGIFFFTANESYSSIFNVDPYDHTIGEYVNGVMFESYYLDSDPNNPGESIYYNNPEIPGDADGANVKNAEQLDRESIEKGFTVFGLDYKVDRGEPYYQNALQHAIVEHGWTEYLAPNRALGAGSSEKIDTYVMDDLSVAEAYPSSHAVNPGEIQVVGGPQFSVNDWDTVPYAMFDGSDIPGSGNQIDWQGVKMAHDTDNLYIFLENESPLDYSYGVQIFIDTDMNRDTGFIGGNGEFTIGADILIQASAGMMLYDFNPNAPQDEWGSNWQARPGSVGWTWANGYLELFIPRHVIWNNNDIRLFLDGDNTALEQADVHDFVPNDANRFGQPNINPYIAYKFE